MSEQAILSHDAGELQALLDKDAIRDCLLRYPRAVDRCDMELWQSVFWPDAHVECSEMFKGDPTDLMNNAIKDPAMFDQTMHMFGNMLIELHGDTAIAETYAQAYHRLPAKNGAAPYDVVIGLRYCDRLEKRGREWRVAHRVMIFDWFREYPDSADWARGAFGQPILPGPAGGARGADDRLYEFIGRGSGTITRA